MQGLQREHFLGNKDPKLAGTDFELNTEGVAYNARYDTEEKNRIVYRHPNTWTNAPAQWVEMLERNEARKNLRVCLAHYASRFQNHLSAKRGFAEQTYDPTPGIEEPAPYHSRPANLPPVEYDPHGKLVPSNWLQTAVDAIEGGDKRLWLDLSHMVALAYSEASRRQTYSKQSGLKIPIEKAMYDDGGRYALAFKKHLSEHESLCAQVMYGSDWHMPHVSSIGPSYLELIEGTLPEHRREDIMGLNAARFFGLESRADGTKGKNRQRLEAFYTHNNVKHPRWMDRLDERLA